MINMYSPRSIWVNLSSAKGINKSANFRFLQRLSVIFGFRETVRDLFPAEATVHEKWLPAETVRVILLPAKTLGRKLNHTDSLCRKLCNKYNSLDRKQEIAAVSTEAKYDGQFVKEA